MALRLIIEDEEGATTIVPLSEEEITIGREAGNTIQLTEQNVSRQHARLTLGADGWMLEDLDSYNGIKVNNVSVEGQVNLQEGDRVQIGDYHLTLVDNVDASTLNLGKQAANDNSASASMRAAPSVDLPVLAPEQAQALSRPAANQTPAPAAYDDYDEPEPAASGGGGKTILILLLLVAAAAGAYFAFAGGDQPQKPSADTTVAKTSAGEPEAKTSAEPETKQGESAGDTKQPAASAGDVNASEGDSGAPDSGEDSGGDTGEDTGGEDTAEDSGEDSGADDSAGAVDTPKDPEKKKKKKKVKKPPKPETPPQPAGDPVDLLNKARAASLNGNSNEAYRLAKESYSIDKNSKALKLMGVSACKMGDEGKAKSVYKKVSASTKNQLSQLCKLKGIDLEQ